MDMKTAIELANSWKHRTDSGVDQRFPEKSLASRMSCPVCRKSIKTGHGHKCKGLTRVHKS